MAKQPKKKPAPKPVAPKKPSKPAPKPAAKSKPAAKPKVTVKPKPAAKTKPAAKQPTKKPVKTTTSAKNKPATKPTKKKAPKKPTKPAAGVNLTGTEATAVYDTITTLPTVRAGAGAGTGVAAAPQIGAPLAGAAIRAGVNLRVNVSTNRADLGYIIELTDITPPGPAPAPVQFPVAAPAGNPFTATIPGANLAPGRTYRIRVLVDPVSGTTPPNGDHAVTVTT